MCGGVGRDAGVDADGRRFACVGERLMHQLREGVAVGDGIAEKNDALRLHVGGG